MLIYGIHTCQNAVLSDDTRIFKVFIQKGKSKPDWLDHLQNKKICVVEEHELKKMLPKDAVHQGIAMEIDMSSVYKDISDLKNSSKNCVVAILDGVTDPHNLGAVIRTAAAFGIHGIIMSDKSSCKITNTAMKSASGGINHVFVYMVKNLACAIETLQEYGFWVVSFCERGEKYLHEINLKGKTCLIFGAEGNGIRRLQKEKSDFVVKLPTNPDFPTLNVSNAAAVAFYEAAKQNDFFY